ncbi:MAG: Stp1/IreP family PP2C-type Ser/Thr phosphatase [Oscillospiraceae bacterium]|nr:Stp1/IreP family PP2C-type Ser/Thr phosphatase [Oscillospiraceae bacterium]
MKIYNKSNVGLVRKTNQDWSEIKILNENLVFAIMCDGMGGAAGGDVACRAAAFCLKSEIEKKFTCSKTEDQNSNCINESEMKSFLTKILAQANNEIIKIGSEQIEIAGLGTTVVIAILINNILSVAHVGDSRAYILENKELRQLTNDHSVVRELMAAQNITEEEACKFVGKNLLTRAIGTQNAESDFFQMQINPGSKILLCTDGLTNHVSDKKICEILSTDDDIKLIADNLINNANASGGTDNITVALIFN